MEKSFYYIVPWGKNADIQTALNRLEVPYVIEPDIPGQNRIVFPDVPVRLYSKIRTLFHGDGDPYKIPLSKGGT